MSRPPAAKPAARTGRRARAAAPWAVFLGVLALTGAYVLSTGRLQLAVALATVTPPGGAATHAVLVSSSPKQPRALKPPREPSNGA